MRYYCLGLCLLLCLGTSTVSAQAAEWTAWVVWLSNSESVVQALHSDGTKEAEIKLTAPAGYTKAGIASVSYTGRYLAHYVYQDEYPPVGESAVVIYDVAEDRFPLIHPMPASYWNGTLVFDEAETHLSLSYNAVDRETNWPNGWQINVFDIQTGTSIAELENKDDQDCVGCTPLVRRFAGDVVTFHLTNREIEDFARPLTWNINTGSLNHDPAYDYFDLDVFPPDGEVLFARYDERFAPSPITGDVPSAYFHAPNTLWIATDGKLFPFFTTPDWWTTMPTFIQNGERVLSGGHIRDSQTGDYQFAIINRDGSIAADYTPEEYPYDLQFVGTPDGFVEFYAPTSTLYHVNTRGATPVKEEVGSLITRGWLSHIQYDVPAGDRGAWRDITPEN